MFKYEVKYTDYNDIERAETLYFNLNKPEAAKFSASMEGGLAEYIKKIYKNKDTKEILKIFDDIIRMSYGVKSDDGLHFVKNDDIYENFKTSEAYSEFYYELATNEELAAAFINGIMPKGFMKEASPEEMAKARAELGLN